MAADTHEEIHFAAMGSEAHVIIHGAPAGLAETARRRIEELEALWSRFIPTSDVSRLNAAAIGEAVPVHPDTVTLVERAVDGWYASGGRFDPMLLADLERAGYDHSFRGPPAISTALPTVAEVTVSRSSAATFDPGGLGKGLAADLVSAELIEAGAVGVMVNLGGDLRVRGTAPDGGAWRIDVENPREPGSPPLATIVLSDGAVATTSRLKRHWVADGAERHHMIDPDTREPATTPVIAATVIAGEGWQAEVLAKVAFLDGFRSDEGLARIERLGAAALIVTDDMEATTSRWDEFIAAPTGQPVGSAA